MTEEEKKPRGRPRKYAGRRPTWTIRLEEKYGEQVKAAADREGRSISEVCEKQIAKSFMADEIIQRLQKSLEEASRELTTCRDQLTVSGLALKSANMLKERAEADLAKAEERAATLLKRMDYAVMRSVELEKSRDSLIQRVDELVELLAIANGIRHKAAS